MLPLTGGLLIVCSYLLVKQTFDIQIFDTFYVIRLKYLYWLLAAFLVLYWLFYKFIRMIYYAASLVGIHIILSMMVCILVIIFHISSGQLYVFHTKLNLYDVPRFQKNNFILTILLLVLAAMQGFFAFNFLWGLKRNNKK